jgi:hypothetical protein
MSRTFAIDGLDYRARVGKGIDGTKGETRALFKFPKYK